MPATKALTKQDRFDFHHHDGIVDRALDTIDEAYVSLDVIRNRRLWRVNFDTWGDYCESKGKTRQHFNRVIQHLEMKQITQKRAGRGQLPGMPERHFRAIKRLPQGEQAEAYAEATRAAGGDKPTQPQVDASVNRRLGLDEGEVQLVDGRGLKADEKFSEVFIAASRFDVLLRSIAHIKGEVEAIIKSAAGAVLAKQHQSIENDRKNMLRALKFAKPYATCPYCGGAGRDDCKACDGRGWVTKEVYDASPAGTN